MQKEVLVIFKTHLDVGYTDLGQAVVDKYLNEYVPRAISVARELEGTDTPFAWTLGSWMVDQALRYDSDGSVERAIRDGLLRWHGLPFTTHTELMSKELFEYGLSISRSLDERFGKRTVGAKMTDVPGHTAAMVPLLDASGIKFLHIGVNAVSPLPNTPDLFKWRFGSSEITVMYEGGYGSGRDFGDFAVYFAHTNDNRGPQSADEVVKIYEKVARVYPNCKIRVADLNDLAEKILTLDNLPTVYAEIGDTWIHGAGTDPKKIGMYREILRHIKKNGITTDLADSLLLVPEHTCGLAGQTYFPNTYAWYAEQMDSPEIIKESERIRASWDEQREYVRTAAKKLGIEVDYALSAPTLDGWKKAETVPDFELSWQLFDKRDITRYINDYMTLDADNMIWGAWDYTKPGLPNYDGGIYEARVIEAYKKDDSELFVLGFDDDTERAYSLPRFYVTKQKEALEVAMIGKGNCRLPQAIWLKFKGLNESWQIEKLGSLINPENVVGSPLIMAADERVVGSDAIIYPLDCCLVAPFGRRLYEYDLKPQGQDLYFNLYNNIWNTNFPLWYSDDTRYRFIIKRTNRC